MKKRLFKNFYWCGARVTGGCYIFGEAERRARSFHGRKIATVFMPSSEPERASLWFNPNNVFYHGKRDVIVVDSNLTSEHTREVLAETAKNDRQPVKYVVNTHGTRTTSSGNRVYRDAFPGVQFIGHRSTLTDCNRRRKQSKNLGQMAVGLSACSKEALKRREPAGQKLIEEERLGYASDINLVSMYLRNRRISRSSCRTVLVDDGLDISQDTTPNRGPLSRQGTHGADLMST